MAKRRRLQYASPSRTALLTVLCGHGQRDNLCGESRWPSLFQPSVGVSASASPVSLVGSVDLAVSGAAPSAGASLASCSVVSS